MRIHKSVYLFLLSTIILFSSCKEKVIKETLVSNIEEYKLAIENAKPGAVIILKNGVWKDVQIKLTGNGTKENPITLKAETAGKVFIEGISNLEILVLI